MDWVTSGFPVLHYLLEFVQTHAPLVGNTHEKRPQHEVRAIQIEDFMPTGDVSADALFCSE